MKSNFIALVMLTSFLLCFGSNDKYTEVEKAQYLLMGTKKVYETAVNLRVEGKYKKSNQLLELIMDDSKDAKYLLAIEYTNETNVDQNFVYGLRLLFQLNDYPKATNYIKGALGEENFEQIKSELDELIKFEDQVYKENQKLKSLLDLDFDLNREKFYQLNISLRNKQNELINKLRVMTGSGSIVKGVDNFFDYKISIPTPNYYRDGVYNITIGSKTWNVYLGNKGYEKAFDEKNLKRVSVKFDEVENNSGKTIYLNPMLVLNNYVDPIPFVEAGYIINKNFITKSFTDNQDESLFTTLHQKEKVNSVFDTDDEKLSDIICPKCGAENKHYAEKCYRCSYLIAGLNGKKEKVHFGIGYSGAIGRENIGMKVYITNIFKSDFSPYFSFYGTSLSGEEENIPFGEDDDLQTTIAEYINDEDNHHQFALNYGLIHNISERVRVYLGYTQLLNIHPTVIVDMPANGGDLKLKSDYYIKTSNGAEIGFNYHIFDIKGKKIYLDLGANTALESAIMGVQIEF